MNRHPNLAFLGGTVIIAIMVMAAFSNTANAGGSPRSKSAETTSVEGNHQADVKAEVET